MASPDSIVTMSRPIAEQLSPRNAVVTVSYGSGQVLEQFLSSLRMFEGELIVAVVDNKPDQDNVSEIAARHDTRYIPLKDNPGYGAGMNAGMNALHDEFGAFDTYFFCNPDVEFSEPVVDTLSRTLLSSDRAGSIGPRLLNEDGTIYPSARNIPSLSTGIGHALFSKIWPSNPWTRFYQNAADYENQRSAGSLSGAAVMVKSSVLQQIGGWDEGYFMHFEDIDLGWRIGRSGYRNIYEPSVAVKHSGAHSTKKHAVMVEKAMTRSAIRFMNKRYAGPWYAPLRWGITLGLSFRGWLKVRAASRG